MLQKVALFFHDRGEGNANQDVGRLGTSNCPRLPHDWDADIHEHTELTGGLHVIKNGGRASRMAYGQVNGVLADCRMRCPLLVCAPSYTTQEYVVLCSAPRTEMTLHGDSGGFFVAARSANRRLRYPVVGIMFGGAQVRWPEQKQGDGSLAPLVEERLRPEYRDARSYEREIAIAVPATRVLRWLAEVRGVEYEFGDEMD